MNKERVFDYWYNIINIIPVNWKNKESIRAFATATDLYAKSYQRLSMEDQGWVSEQVSLFYKQK